MPSATVDNSQIGVDERRSNPAQPAVDIPALASATRFVREYSLRVLLISSAILIPCFWHRHIEAGDLASHTYNAWLAELIAKGHAPGLWIARQWNNVLYDVAVSSLGNLVGLRAAEKIVVASAVLIFFWGAFALMAAAARRAPWFVLPCLAIFTYGWTFEMGFINFYISLGLAFWGLALLWHGQGWEQAWVVPLAALSWVAHPLGAVLLFGAGAYLALTRILRPRFQFYATAAAALLLLFVPGYLGSHYPVRWSSTPALYFNGSDQLFLYGARYQILGLGLLGLIVLFLAWDLIGRRGGPGWFLPLSVSLQLYGLSLLAAWSLPSGIQLPQYPAPLNLLSERFTSICAIFMCCVLSVMKPKKWHILGFSLVAAVFFAFLFQDTGKVDRMETDAEHLVAQLPNGARVIATIWTFPASRVFIMHIVDRASIGHVFSYGDYEPSTLQFRVRANPGNNIVVTGFAAGDAIQTGQYVVRQQDVPLAQIYQCDLGLTRLCMRDLTVGERNGRVGIQASVRSNSSIPKANGVR
jgi:hypothetical protein